MLEILPYNETLDKRWDRFVMQESVNGTFLQTRRFLNYHPSDRFTDASFLIESSGTIVAAFPGNILSDGKWISHQGSTFGGPVISKHFYSAERLIHIMDEAENYLKGICSSAMMRPTSSLFSTESTALIEYILEHRGYRRQTELSAVCTLEKDADPLDNCEKTCRSVFRKSIPFELEYRDMTDSEMPVFYDYLCQSKAKYNVKPVHTLDELLDLRHNRISGEVKFKALWMKNTFVAGMMLFDFAQANVRHAQYIAPNDEIKSFHPTTAMYVNVMREAAKDGFSRFSWGISTEKRGEYLNLPLFKFKESLGAKASLNPIYTKEL